MLPSQPELFSYHYYAHRTWIGILTTSQVCFNHQTYQLRQCLRWFERSRWDELTWSVSKYFLQNPSETGHTRKTMMPAISVSVIALQTDQSFQSSYSKKRLCWKNRILTTMKTLYLSSQFLMVPSFWFWWLHMLSIFSWDSLCTITYHNTNTKSPDDLTTWCLLS